MPAAFFGAALWEETLGNIHGRQKQMAQSFTATETGALAKITDGIKRHVLVTGAAGRIGSYFVKHAAEKYALRLMVRGDEEGIEYIQP